MHTLEFTVLVGIGSLLAGFLGSLTGLGGGVVIVPLLTLLFHVDIRYAIGAALVSVDCHFFGSRCGVCQRGLLEYSRGHVSGDCHDRGSAGRGGVGVRIFTRR